MLIDTDKTPDEKEEEKVDNVHDQTFEDILSIPELDEEIKKDEEKKEEIVTPTPPIEEKEVAPPLDAEKLKQDITESVVTALAGDVTTTKEEKADLVSEFLKDHPEPTWQDAFKFLKESTEMDKESLKKEIKEDIVREKQEQEELQVKQAKEQEEAFNKTNEAWQVYWDQQLKELEEGNKIPVMVNPDDPKDPGRVVRFDLFKELHVANEERQSKGLPIDYNLKSVYYESYQEKQNKQPLGADAPIAGTRKSVSQGNDKETEYQDIHKASFEDILLGKV